MTNLEKIFNQLDITRLALNRNFTAYDDELQETYDEFLFETNILIDLLKKEVDENE